MITTSREPLSASAACAAAAVSFIDSARAAQAARVCERCPLAGPCLEEALAYDLAHKLGRDRHGITGVCAGIWFEPGKPPRRIVDERSDAEKAAA